MRDRHWTQEELVAGLFGLEPEDRHLAACPECRRRLDSMRQRRDTLAAAIEGRVSGERLAAQRLAIRSRIGNRNRKFNPFLVPTFAAAALIALTVFISLRPTTAPEQQVRGAAAGDEVLEEAYRMSTSLEPAALIPVQALFEEQQ